MRLINSSGITILSADYYLPLFLSAGLLFALFLSADILFLSVELLFRLLVYFFGYCSLENFFLNFQDLCRMANRKTAGA